MPRDTVLTRDDVMAISCFFVLGKGINLFWGAEDVGYLLRGMRDLRALEGLFCWLCERMYGKGLGLWLVE